MRRIFGITLLMIISVGMLVGCNVKKEEKTVESFINKLVSAEEYNNKETNIMNDLNSAFSDYLTDNALELLVSNRVPRFYYNIINEEDINDTSDIKITKVNEAKNDEYYHYEYEVSYKLNSDTKSIEMSDYMVFKVLDDGDIDEVYVIDSKSSIFSEYKKIRK